MLVFTLVYIHSEGRTGRIHVPFYPHSNLGKNRSAELTQRITADNSS
jgi:hypothetical protein